MKNKLFIVGIVIFAFGAMAMDSVGAGGMIACVMVALGTVLAFAGYASEQLEKKRRKTARRIQKLRRQ